MATQMANGGVARRWVDANGWRLVLCHNGVWLINNGGGRWRRWREQPSVQQAERVVLDLPRWRAVHRWSDPSP